jgi:RNA-dependent RNA polymerase
MNEVFTRIKRVLTNGVLIGDRKYEYLACGNSQFREHGAYFFAPSPNLPTDKIRRWMGSFEEIETVPLYASRIGQCFSTTRAIHGAAATLVEIPDIERNGFKFTDGVGRISTFLATLAASELGISHNSPEPPSVFQIRVGGCKGILAVSPMCSPQEIHIRKTQYKFPAMHEGLEIIRWSQFACANLNRQLILILSALGVPNHVFSQKLQLQLSKLEKAMTDETVALSILQKDIDHNQMTLALASMILDGFQKNGEPFMMSLLQLWRAWSIKYLKEKARITIGGGALLLGCVDETAILRGHFNETPRPLDDAPINQKAKDVPQVFVQLSNNPDGKPEAILGPMLLARNPSLHPGDVRVVCGVDIPELHHLKDVVVLPQTGDRDVAGMCSGGDLDGDDFLVIWDQDLLPHEWNHEPMDYTPPEKIKHGKNIGIDDLTTFFVTYMKNDTLARIANAHLANADYLDDGVKDERCRYMDRVDD